MSTGVMLNQMKYAQLQKLAKKHGIKANQKVPVVALSSHTVVHCRPTTSSSSRPILFMFLLLTGGTMLRTDITVSH